MNLNAIWTSALINLLRMATSGAIVAKVIELVKSASDMSISGEEKKRAVLLALREVGGELEPLIREVGTSVLNLLIEAAVAYIKARQK